MKKKNGCRCRQFLAQPRHLNLCKQGLDSKTSGSSPDEAAPTPRNQGTEAPLRNEKVCYRLSSPRAFDW
jgi:hypothetical protein